MKETIIGIIALVAAYVILVPIAVLWSLNTLFPVLNIPINFDTWCAVVVVGTFIRGTVTVKK
jgi:hypothetical protein